MEGKINIERRLEPRDRHFGCQIRRISGASNRDLAGVRLTTSQRARLVGAPDRRLSGGHPEHRLSRLLSEMVERVTGKAAVL